MGVVQRIEPDGTITTLIDNQVARQQWSDKRVAAHRKRTHPDNKYKKTAIEHYIAIYGRARWYSPGYPDCSQWIWVEINGKPVELETPIHNFRLGMAFSSPSAAELFAKKVSGKVGRIDASYGNPHKLVICGENVDPSSTNYQKL